MVDSGDVSDGYVEIKLRRRRCWEWLCCWSCWSGSGKPGVGQQAGGAVITPGDIVPKQLEGPGAGAGANVVRSSELTEDAPATNERSTEDTDADSSNSAHTTDGASFLQQKDALSLPRKRTKPALPDDWRLGKRPGRVDPVLLPANPGALKRAPLPPIASTSGAEDTMKDPQPGRPRYLTPPRSGLSSPMQSFRGSWRKLTQTLKGLLHLDDTEEAREEEKIQVFVGTWNMNGMIPITPLDKFLTTDAQSSNLLLLATQECEERLETSSLRQPRTKPKWVRLVSETLLNDWEPVVTRTMVGLHIGVWCRGKLRGRIKDVRTAEYKTDRTGCKGAIGVSFVLGGKTWAFINSHLTAHEGAVERRNHDWRKINEHMPLHGYLPEVANKGTVSTRFNYTFWAGDFNYRCALPRSAFLHYKNILESPNSDLHPFIDSDELQKAISEGAVFEGWSEHPITFRPTYKFDPMPVVEKEAGSPQRVGPLSPTKLFEFWGRTSPSSSRTSPIAPVPALVPTLGEHGPTPYDTSAKQRMPSYTDRILYRVNPPATKNDNTEIALKITPALYSAIHSMIGSDHKPVIGVFEIFGCDVNIMDDDESDDRYAVKVVSSNGCFGKKGAVAKKDMKGKGRVVPT
ncbi:hypothetical protein HDU85_003024 [Gaertneriomyces sp. JEL0708]|nr:hypothetical protein HDU85_003024 [Gaertneriomyces sp. JEL0708]